MKLQSWLYENDLSVPQFAKMAKKAPMTIYRYIRGERFPPREMQLSIAKLTNKQVMPNDWVE